MIFTDDKDAEKIWQPEDARTATDEFWKFVADRAAAHNEVFTIEDESAGEGIQLHFYADSIARITKIPESERGSGAEHRVEYSLVDDLDGYRQLVRARRRRGAAQRP
ncbi:DUF6357 family protein [Agreia sp.]|uniref:DUF6357 family protein n=1 Tax=Agreia sp. TaxID=1872416 RepID=UPI0035BBD00A